MRTIQGNAGTAERRLAVETLVADVGRTFKELRCVGSQRLVKLGISMTHLHVLTMLRHHGPLPMSRLAEVLDVSLSNATGIVDRLEDRGYVQRVRVKDDRRVVLVEPLPAADVVMEQIDVLRSDMIGGTLDRLDEDQLAVIEAGLRQFHEALVVELEANPHRYAHGPNGHPPEPVGLAPADPSAPRLDLRPAATT